jgi:hypothetical protein
MQNVARQAAVDSSKSLRMDAGENFVIPLLTLVRDTECMLWLIGFFRGAGCVQRQGAKWGRGETRSAREEGYFGRSRCRSSAGACK